MVARSRRQKFFEAPKVGREAVEENAECKIWFQSFVRCSLASVGKKLHYVPRFGKCLWTGFALAIEPSQSRRRFQPHTADPHAM
jgi:hypothetical protein